MIVINSSTRQFNIPGAEMTFGVEADAGSERKYFQCPRYVGNKLDIASSFVRINYRNANGEIDSYLVEDLTVDGDNVTFSWELYPKVTAYKGQVRFVMCVVGPDTKVAWHTTLGTGVVLEGLEPDYAVIQAGTADVVAQLIALVDKQTAAVENKGAEWVRNVQSEGTDQVIAVQTAAQEAQAASVAEIEAKGVNTRESIPEDYTSLENTVDSLVRGRAGAIVCEVEGSAVVVNDSSNLPMQGLRVFGKTTQVTTTGKNLLNTNNTATFLNNQSKEKTGVVVPIETDGVYSYYIADSITVYVGYADSLDVAATHYTSALKDKPATGTIELKAGQYFLLWFDTGVTVRDSTGYSLAFGTEVTHEPYSGGKPSPSPDYPQELVSLEPVVTVTGKNLFNIESLRVTRQDDGGYLLPSYPKKPMVVFPNGYAGQMTVSGWIKYESTDNRGGYIMVQYTDGTDDRVGVINPSLDYQRYELTTRIDKVIAEVDVSYGVGTVATYFKNVQVEFGTTATAYEPYSGQTVELTHTLPGIPVTSGGNYTDSNGQQWICDEVDLERGVYVRRLFFEKMTDFTKATSYTYDGLGTSCAVAIDKSVTAHTALCSHFVIAHKSTTVDRFNLIGKTIYFKLAGELSWEEWVARMSELAPVVIGVLDTPIETALSENEIAAYRAMHSNYPNTTVLNDVGAHMVVKYAADTKLYIDNKITALIGG